MGVVKANHHTGLEGAGFVGLGGVQNMLAFKGLPDKDKTGTAGLISFKIPWARPKNVGFSPHISTMGCTNHTAEAIMGPNFNPGARLVPTKTQLVYDHS